MNKKPTIVITIIVIFAIILVFGYLSSKYQIKTYQEKTTQSPQSISAPASNPMPVSDSRIFNIDIKGFAFNPPFLAINASDTVTWTNNDSVPHKIAGDGFASDLLNKGATYTFKFNSAGTYNYHCTIHPSMTGVIIVK